MYGPVNWLAAKIIAALGYTPLNAATPATLATDDTYQGETQTGFVANGSIGQWQPVFANGTPKLTVSAADDPTSMPCIGITVAAYTDGQSAVVLKKGIWRNDGNTWTVFGNIAGSLYVNEGGDIVHDVSSFSSGSRVQYIGYAISAHVAIINVDPNFYELA